MDSIADSPSSWWWVLGGLAVMLSLLYGVPWVKEKIDNLDFREDL